MEIGRIAGATRNLGAPEGWNPETDGHCGGLPVRDEQRGASHPQMVSAWIPTPDEVERLQAGAPIYLVVAGTVHPPVAVMIGQPPSMAGG